MMKTRLGKVFAALLLSAVSFGAASAQGFGAEAREQIRRGNELYARAEYEAAIETYARVPRDAGEAYAQALYNIGVCRYELWQTGEAVRLYKLAVEARRGRYPKASYALGVALEDLNRLPEAKEAYTRAAAAGYATALHRLGILASREGDRDLTTHERRRQ